MASDIFLSAKSVSPRFAAPIFTLVSVPLSATCVFVVSILRWLIIVFPLNFERLKIHVPFAPFSEPEIAHVFSFAVIPADLIWKPSSR